MTSLLNLFLYEFDKGVFLQRKRFYWSKNFAIYKGAKSVVEIDEKHNNHFLFNQYRNKKSNKIKPKTIKIYKIKYRQYLQFD